MRTIDEYVASLGVTFHPPAPVLQRTMEQLFKAIEQYRTGTTSYQINGALARAACDLGWVQGFTAADVENQHPTVIAWIGRQVNALIVEADTVPGE